MPIHLAPDLIEATQDTQAFVLYSSCMKSLAIKLSKVSNDLRLLASGHRCGLREINLPATVTALNPVIGYDRSTELAREAMKSGRGILELIREQRILSEEKIARVLDPAAMTGGRPA